ncbi:MAG: hypothetical protein GC168_03795 [Candidatus Hydrogenedens sp.]|nr:hypothetical protein [Candidatus Hydrogenedens sp.]
MKSLRLKQLLFTGGLVAFCGLAYAAVYNESVTINGALTVTTDPVTFDTSLKERSNIYLGDGTNFKGLYIDARAGGDLASNTSKRMGIVGNGQYQFTISAQNNHNLQLFDDSSNGIVIFDGGYVDIATAGGAPSLTLDGAIEWPGTGTTTNAGITATADGDVVVQLGN